jgi:hypothetical protein
MSSAFLANGILLIHTIFVAFVVLSVPLILVGAWRKWHWVGHPAFRLPHFLAILYVTINTLSGKMCPLTVWENTLRQEAGQQGNGSSFIAHWLGKVLFYDFPSWIFTFGYTLFALSVVALFWIAPIRWGKAKAGHL